MNKSDLRKKITDSWFSYLQSQICKEFEVLEGSKFKFKRRDWNKKNRKEGGGTSYILSGGKIFDKVGVNKSTVSGIFPKQFRKNILGAGKNGKYWASGVSVVAHMRNPKIPALHFNTRFIVTSKEWFGGGMDATPSFNDNKEKKIIHDQLKKICKNYKVKFIINDNPLIAKKVMADGCHLGQKDIDIKRAREVLKNKIEIKKDIPRTIPPVLGIGTV